MQIVHRHEDGRLEFENTGREIPELNGWSGSSQLVAYRGNWLCVVHLRNNSPLSFRHAFVELDRDFHVLRFSEPFTFDGLPIEFCAGLALTRDHAILSYGIGDREAYLMRLPLGLVEKLLRRDQPSAFVLKMLHGIGSLLRPFGNRTDVLQMKSPAGSPSARN